MPRLGGALALALVGALALVAAGHSHGAADPSGRRTITLGRSVDGRPITAVEVGDFESAT